MPLNPLEVRDTLIGVALIELAETTAEGGYNFNYVDRCKKRILTILENNA